MSAHEVQQGKNTKYIQQLSYNITSGDDYIMVDTSIGPVSLYLPNIKGAGLDFAPKKFYVNDSTGNAGTNNITIYGTGGNLVNSTTTVVLNNAGASSEILIVNNNEYLVNRDIGYAGAVWGSITGNILNQTDLQAQFATKQDVLLYYKESSGAPVSAPVNAGTLSVVIGDTSSNDAGGIGNYVFGSSNTLVTCTNTMVQGLNNAVTSGNEALVYAVSSFFTTVTNSAFLGRTMSYSAVSNAYGFGETLTGSHNSNMLIGYALTSSFANAIEIGPDNTRKLVLRNTGAVALGSSNDIVFTISGGWSASGTGGAGYGEYVGQSSAPLVGASNTMRMYAGASGALSWRRNDSASDTFTRTLDGTLTANRTYILQDADGIIAFTSALTGFFANGGNAFGGVATLGTTDNFALNILTNNVSIGGFSATGDFSIGTTTAGARLYTKGSTSDNTAHAFKAVNSSDTNMFSILNDGTVMVHGGNGFNGTFELHQKSGGTTHIMTVYNTSYAKAMMTITDNGSAGAVTLSAGALTADPYNYNVALGGLSPNTARLRIPQDTTNDIIAITPSSGNGGIYANSSTGITYFYFQDASAVTQSVIATTGVSYLGGALDLRGTAGNGYLGVVAQSSAPSSPSGAGFRHYAGSTGAFSWRRNDGATDTFTRTLDGTLTANRTYTLPDASGTLSFGTGANTRIAYWSGANTLTSSADLLFDANGNVLIGIASATSTGNILEMQRSLASTLNATLRNTSASNGAYCQYTVSNNSTVINLGMVGAGTTTSGVYVQGEAYNMTSSTGYSFGTVNVNGQVRIYYANGTLGLNITSAGVINMPNVGTNGANFQGLVGTTTSSALYLNQSSPSATNFALASPATGTTLVNGTGNVTIQYQANNRIIINSGGFNFTPGQGTAGTSIFQTTISNNSNQTAGANVPKIYYSIGTTSWATGALAQADFVQWTQPSVLFAGASTATLTNTFTINGAPIASTNATITTSVALYISAGSSLTASVTTGYGVYINPPTGAGTNYALGLAGSVNVLDANNFVFGTSTGTKLGTSTSQKIGFWNVTPIVQPANTVAIDDVLINTGLRASGGSANFSLKITNSLPQNLKSYTVATLPAGVQGDVAYVTDATAPTFLATLVGGGAVKCPAFYDGTNWVAF